MIGRSRTAGLAGVLAVMARTLLMLGAATATAAGGCIPPRGSGPVVVVVGASMPEHNARAAVAREGRRRLNWNWNWTGVASDTAGVAGAAGACCWDGVGVEEAAAWWGCGGGATQPQQ